MTYAATSSFNSANLSIHTHSSRTSGNKAAGKYSKQPCHPQSLQVATSLIQTFQSRSCNARLSPHTLNRLVPSTSDTIIQAAISLPSDTGTPFTMSEIKLAHTTGSNTTPRIDKTFYSMFNHLGPHALSHMTYLFNSSLEAGCLPMRWK